MKQIITGTFAAVVLGAAIASSQTPQQGAQSPSGEQKAGGQTTTQQPAGGRQAQGNTTSTTYTGYLRGSAATGYTFSPIGNRAGSGAAATAPGGAAAGTSGAPSVSGTSGAGAAGRITYNIVAGEQAKVDFTKLADQCVEIVGVVVPATGASGMNTGAGAQGQTSTGGNLAAGNTSTAGNTSAGGTAAGGENTDLKNTQGQTNRTLTVTSIRAVQGGCTQ